MKVLVSGMWPLNSFHLEAELDLAERHLRAGDTVYILACQATLESCEVNRSHIRRECLRCVSRRNTGLNLLSKPITVLPIVELTPDIQAELATLPDVFQTKKELWDYRIENFDIGISVLSSVVSCLKQTAPDLQKHRDFVNALLRSALMAYRTMQKHIERERFDHAYIFNGRFATVRALVRACESKSVPYTTHDRGYDQNSFRLFPDNLPHSITLWRRLIEKQWSEAGELREREAKAREFYTSRRKAENKAFESFTKKQEQGRLPADFARDGLKVAVFTSSDDEFAAIGDEWSNSVYPDQQSAIKALGVDERLRCAGVRFFVRLHPRLAQLSEDQWKPYLALQSDRVQVIAPDDVVDSYRLMQEADIVVSFGSSVGIEATYWGKASILLGTCFYEDLDVTYNPKTHNEVVALLLGPSLSAKPVIGALKFGYFLNTYGERFKYGIGTGIAKAQFKGVDVTPGRAMRRYLSLPFHKGTLGTIMRLRIVRFLYERVSSLLLRFGCSPRSAVRG